MNSIVKDENGNVYRIKNKLGSGGQGTVFTVADDDSIVIKAMTNGTGDKIISDPNKYEEYKQAMIKIASIGEFEYLAVPLAMLEKPLCGYVMLFMNGLQSIDNLMKPSIYKDKSGDRILTYDKIRNKSIKSLPKTPYEIAYAYNCHGGLLKRLKVLARLAKIMGRLQDKNVVYCDLSPANVFVSKSESSFETWLIDLDNLKLARDVRNGIGTPNFMAPEVVKGEKNTIYSDRYSFALIAYQTLFMKEPFNGSLRDDYDDWDSDATNKNDEDPFQTAISRGEIPWIFELNDDSNRPDNAINPHEYITEDLFNLFERTFNAQGRAYPNTRPDMWEWYSKLIEAIESIMRNKLDLLDDEFEFVVNNSDYERNIDITHLGKTFYFDKTKKEKRLKVNIYNARPLIADDTNQEYEMSHDKTIYWQLGKHINDYYLSNYDVCDVLDGAYIQQFITITGRRNLFATEREYSISVNNAYPDYSAVLIKEDKQVDATEDLINTKIFVKHNQTLIKRITIELED